MNWFSHVRLPSSARRCGVALTLGLLAAGLVWAGAVRASSASGGSWKVQRSPSPSNNSGLTAVAATSRTNAWAVGNYVKGTQDKTLIEHWNGKAWKVQKGPNVGGLRSVAATSPTNAWAVGSACNATACRTLAEHWNGKAWKVQPSPSPRGNALLSGVAATSPTNAWAVGSYAAPTEEKTLIMHWNGKKWKVQKSPNPNPGETCACYHSLTAVAATSRTNAWVVGYYVTDPSPGAPTPGVIEHWNGKAWTVQTSPYLNGAPLSGVAATSPTNAWAVPSFGPIVHWTGKTWKVQKSPNLSGFSPDEYLPTVAATSSTNAWAVSADYHTIWRGSEIVHWNGKTWKIQKSPNKGTNLSGVAATSPTNAWVVGNYSPKIGQQLTLIERWTGKG